MTDPEQQIMQKIVRLERRRTRIWLAVFWVVVGVLVIFVVLSVISIFLTLRERESLKVFDIYTEGWDVLRQGWFDALRSVWYDIPRHHLLPAVSTIILAIVILVLTRRQRTTIRRKQASIAEYNQKTKTDGRR